MLGLGNYRSLCGPPAASQCESISLIMKVSFDLLFGVSGDNGLTWQRIISQSHNAAISPRSISVRPVCESNGESIVGSIVGAYFSLELLCYPHHNGERCRRQPETKRDGEDQL